ncbi:MAG: hypothetical protein V2J08_15340 [Desulfotignum sp.]|jgi:hypothetical protein|nr:hypothetical protein [Desulfotignum sp.]
MVNKSQDNQQQALRSEVRSAASESASISFQPPKAEMEYHFKLRDFSASGLGLLVKNDSRLLQYIDTGDIFCAKYYKENAAIPPEHLKVQIQHISTPAGGKPENHVIVGLYFLEKIPK